MVRKKSGLRQWGFSGVLFLFCFSVGLFAVSRTGMQESQMSSLSDTSDLNDTNYNELQSLNDAELMHQLEKNPPVESQEPYALSIEELETIDRQIYPKPEYKTDFEVTEIADNTIKTQFEDPKDAKVCTPARLFYEKQIVGNPKLKDLYTPRTEESGGLPIKCLTHVMNQMNLAKSSVGVCASSSGRVRVPGAKPCVTEKLVTMTHNSFVDVMDCLNLNPKLFLPKIARESGFLLNAYGAGKDGGIGQLTKAAIDDVNQDYSQYLAEIEKAAATKPSCARIIRYKSLLNKASSSAEQRCSMIGLPENPLRNVLYLGIFNKSNMDRFSGIRFIAGRDFLVHSGQTVPVTYNAQDEFEGTAKANRYKEQLEELGIKNPNMHFFKEVLTLASYNMGSPTAIRLFGSYLEKRRLTKKRLTMDDFDFNKVRIAKDIYGDGSDKNVIEIARSFVMSSFISKKDKPAARALKLKRRRQLPKEWAGSYLKSFPEYLAFNANSYNGKQITAYSVYGSPGYVSFVADQNRDLRNVFNGAGIDPNYCSDPNFLKFTSR